MKVAGIVAEYNPFHSGHRYQIARTRAALGETAAVVAVMSGNWVQQAYPAAADKWTRARLALMGGVDLVLELPTVWACSSAESFARGAVDVLAAAGVVDVLSFGSECGDVDALQRVAACLDSPSYQAELRRLTDSGRPFAAARQQAVEELLPARLSDLLSTPNNNLGVEYIKELNALSATIVPMTVRREGAAHNSVEARRSRFVSATRLRLDLAAGDWDAAVPYLVEGGAPCWSRSAPCPQWPGPSGRCSPACAP